MKEKILKNFLKPCSRCPYKLGIVHTFVDPCPQCRMSGYSMFKRFTEEYEQPEPSEKRKMNKKYPR